MLGCCAGIRACSCATTTQGGIISADTTFCYVLLMLRDSQLVAAEVVTQSLPILALGPLLDGGADWFE